VSAEIHPRANRSETDEVSAVPDNAAATPVKAGQTADRVGYFTDAVFAIAMTLLVIEIPRPEGADFDVGGGVSKAQAAGRLWRFLVAHNDAFYAYLLAFYVLWIVWREHHVLLDQVSRVSASMIGWHFPLLLLVAFLPYATAVEGRYAANPVASLLFGLAVGGLLLCRTAIQTQASRADVLLPEVDRRSYRVAVIVSWIVVGYWAATLALVWWAPWVQISWFLTGAVAYLAGRIMTRREVRRSTDSKALA
jgi:uncharacterized membrane protein